MREVFSFSRFGKLFVKHTVDHYRSYLMSIAVVAGVLILGGSFFTYLVNNPVDPGGQLAIFSFLLALGGTIFTSTIFSDLGEKRKSIPTLLLPASALEKFLIGWLYSYAVFTLIFTVMYYLALVVVIYSQSMRGNNDQMMAFFSNNMFLTFMVFSLLHSIAIFGAIFFEKLHFIKTAFCFFVALGLLILLNTLFATAMTGKNVAPLIPFSFIGFWEENHFYNVSLRSDKASWVIWIIITVTIFFWTAAYFRFKEKRV